MVNEYSCDKSGIIVLMAGPLFIVFDFMIGSSLVAIFSPYFSLNFFEVNPYIRVTNHPDRC